MKQILKYIRKYVKSHPVKKSSLVLGVAGILCVTYFVGCWLNVVAHNQTPGYVYSRVNIFYCLFGEDRTGSDVSTHSPSVGVPDKTSSETSVDKGTPKTSEILTASTPQLSKTSNYYDIPLTSLQQDYLFSVCQEYKLDPEVVMSIMYVESRYTVDSVSKTNDYGIMQINKSNHKNLSKILGVTDFLSFEDNVRAGCYLLSTYTSRYSSEQAVLCYHLGERGASKYIRSGDYWTSYIKAVFNYKETLHRG